MTEIEMIGESKVCPGCGKEIDVPVKVDGVTYCLSCAAELKGQPAVPSEATGLELEEEPVMPDVEEPETDDEEVEEDEIEEVEEETESEEETPNEDATEDAGQETEKPKEKVSDILVDDAKEEVKSTIRNKKKKARDALVSDPDSLSERWRRMRLIREGYVVLKTLSRDEKTGDFLLDTTLIKRADLPIAAVAVTNEKHVYCLDTIKTSPWYQENRPRIADPFEAQFTARDGFLHMNTNKYDNAMAVRWSDTKQIDYKKFLLPIAGGIAVVLLIVLLGAR